MNRGVCFSFVFLTSIQKGWNSCKDKRKLKHSKRTQENVRRDKSGIFCSSLELYSVDPNLWKWGRCFLPMLRGFSNYNKQHYMHVCVCWISSSHVRVRNSETRSFIHSRRTRKGEGRRRRRDCYLLGQLPKSMFLFFFFFFCSFLSFSWRVVK